jgi:hypothetical protein
MVFKRDADYYEKQAQNCDQKAWRLEKEAHSDRCAEERFTRAGDHLARQPRDAPDRKPGEVEAKLKKADQSAKKHGDDAQKKEAEAKKIREKAAENRRKAEEIRGKENERSSGRGK